MKIRQIEARDDAILKQIIQASLESADLAIPGTAYFDPELAQLSAYYDRTDKRAYFVLADHETILGGAGIAEFDEDRKIAELQKLYLIPAAQGQGASHLLMQAVLDFAKKVGYSAIYLESHHSLNSALALYEKYGFESLNEPLLPTPHNAMDRFYLKKIN